MQALQALMLLGVSSFAVWGRASLRRLAAAPEPARPAGPPVTGGPITPITPITPIAEVVDGAAVRVAGRAAGAAAVTAPLSGRACVYADSQLQRRDRDAWIPLARIVTAARLELVDRTGTATIAIAHAVVAIDPDQIWPARRRGATPAQQALVALARRDGHAVRGGLRFVERAVVAGDRLEVIGVATRALDNDGGAPEVGYRDPAATRVRFDGSPAAPVQIRRA